MGEYLLAFDVGTSSCKAALFNLKGKLIALASKGHPTYRPNLTYVEQDPRDWWEGVRVTIKKVLRESEISPRKIRGIGSCGQNPTQVLVNKKGKVLRPAIVWQDSRAIEEAKWIEENIGPERMRKFLGVDLVIDPSWIPSRLLWLSRYEKSILERTYKIIQPKDYINFKLTGIFASDTSSSRGFINFITKKADREYLSLLGIAPELVPQVYEPFEVLGVVTKVAAKFLGLSPGIPVVTGWNDSWCSMLGTGPLSPGIGIDIAGTSEIVGSTSSQVVNMASEVQMFEFLDNLKIIYGSTKSAGASLQWFEDNFPSLSLRSIKSRIKGNIQSYDINRISAGSNGLVFLPYLQGERAPIWDPRAKGAFIGITQSHTRAHFMKSVMEGVAYSIRHVLELAEGCGDTKVQEVRVAGGGAKNGVWNRIKADVLGKRIIELEVAEAGLLGGAMLAAIGVGIYRDYREAMEKMVQAKREILPDRKNCKIYSKLFKVYKDLYPALRGAFHEISQI